MKTTRKRKSKTKIPTESKLLIRVQLDFRTVITITKIKTFASWKEKYPDAKIIYPLELAD